MSWIRFRLPLAGLFCACAAAALAPPAAADTLGGVTAPVTGGARVTGAIVLGGQRGPTVSGRRAALIGDKAYAPSKAPDAVKRVIWAANKIRHKPYKWGGGHASWNDSGYDCSGSVSYALHGGGLLRSPMDSTGFESYGSRGRGRWITIYANGGHAYMVVAGLRFDTSGRPHSNSTRWHREGRSGSGFVVRHPTHF
jgi:hypothetical protein